MKQYRIKELNGWFVVQVLKRGLFGKNWEDCNYNGEPVWLLDSPYSYESLQKAKDKINQWLEKPKYHQYP